MEVFFFYTYGQKEKKGVTDDLYIRGNQSVHLGCEIKEEEKRET